MLLNEMLIALNHINDYTRLGHLIKDADSFIAETDYEFEAKRAWQEFIKSYFNDRFSAYITAETIKQILDSKDEIYNPEKLGRAAAFLRNRLKPAQIITDDWLVYFIRGFK